MLAKLPVCALVNAGVQCCIMQGRKGGCYTAGNTVSPFLVAHLLSFSQLTPPCPVSILFVIKVFKVHIHYAHVLPDGNNYQIIIYMRLVDVLHFRLVTTSITVQIDSSTPSPQHHSWHF